MNQQQLNEAITVVEKDATLQCRYYREGASCAIGGLAVASGVPVDVLVKAGSMAINCGGSIVWPICDAIGKRFGLTVRQMQVIQNENDESHDQTERREKIIAALKRFAETEVNL